MADVCLSRVLAVACTESCAATSQLSLRLARAPLNMILRAGVVPAEKNWSSLHA